MLFDLKGKRRRAVQITYIALALLMGLGLVGFGIGGGTSGGLFDVFGGGGGGSSTADKTVQKKIDRAERALRLNPKDEAALASLVRSHYQLASLDTNQQTGKFGKDGKKELRKADVVWKRYVDTAKKPDDSLASLMVVAYSPAGLNDPSSAAGAAEVVATVRDDAQGWLQLVQYAALAGQTRKADLAGKKALAKAPKNQRKLVKDTIAQYKKGAASKGGAGATPGGATPAPTSPGG